MSLFWSLGFRVFHVFSGMSEVGHVLKKVDDHERSLQPITWQTFSFLRCNVLKLPVSVELKRELKLMDSIPRCIQEYITPLWFLRSHFSDDVTQSSAQNQINSERSGRGRKWEFSYRALRSFSPFFCFGVAHFPLPGLCLPDTLLSAAVRTSEGSCSGKVQEPGGVSL